VPNGSNAIALLLRRTLVWLNILLSF